MKSALPWWLFLVVAILASLISISSGAAVLTPLFAVLGIGSSITWISIFNRMNKDIARIGQIHCNKCSYVGELTFHGSIFNTHLVCPKCKLSDWVAILPYSKELSSATSQLNVARVSGLTKICPVCAESVKLEAKKCRFCGEAFDMSSKSTDINVEQITDISSQYLGQLNPKDELKSNQEQLKLSSFQSPKCVDAITSDASVKPEPCNMILIVCPNCGRQYRIDINRIPANARTATCKSCNSQFPLVTQKENTSTISTGKYKDLSASHSTCKRKCPSCGELVKLEARFCEMCGFAFASETYKRQAITNTVQSNTSISNVKSSQAVNKFQVNPVNTTPVDSDLNKAGILKYTNDSDNKVHRDAENNFTKTCQTCQNTIMAEARKCRFCGNVFSDDSIKQLIDDIKDNIDKARILYKEPSYCPKCNSLSHTYKDATSQYFCPKCNMYVSQIKSRLNEDNNRNSMDLLVKKRISSIGKVRCLSCSEFIKKEAKKCRFCGQELATIKTDEVQLPNTDDSVCPICNSEVYTYMDFTGRCYCANCGKYVSELLEIMKCFDICNE